MKEELKTKIEGLCNAIEAQHFKAFPSLKDYGVTFKAGRKFCNCLLYTSPSPRDRG